MSIGKNGVKCEGKLFKLFYYKKQNFVFYLGKNKIKRSDFLSLHQE